MPNWNDVLKEIGEASANSPVDVIRKKYLTELGDYTNRNIIAYYSGFLQKTAPDAQAMGSINDDDKNGFMNVIHGMDTSKGLDLIIHTPGGDIAAVESIVNYLHSKFGNDIRAIVPQMAMSAGTMLSCACKEIVMGKQSNLGPFDPQFGGIPAHGVLEEFEKAKREVLQNPAAAQFWQLVLHKYHPTFVGECEKAISWASIIVKQWLMNVMFSGDPDAETKADSVVSALNNHEDTFAHARHIHLAQIRELGLVVSELEDDQNFQDLVLTVHHSYMHTLGGTTVMKAIENNTGRGVFWHANPQQFQPSVPMAVSQPFK
ncbi:SDH family Clp fold serine proteinase [Vibrio sinaloensis]|uniref:SDH family Clp fold serine proteinase n=1 Tax=Photobacterium sp. (strain ATCC 43367) TaxID=379097 RepID=UPI00069250D1|nr:serine protease [Vibrio sinaloensis]